MKTPHLEVLESTIERYRNILDGVVAAPNGSDEYAYGALLQAHALCRIADALESPALTAICSAADSLRRIADALEWQIGRTPYPSIPRPHEAGNTACNCDQCRIGRLG